MTLRDALPVDTAVQNPARLPHGTTQDQVNGMESEGQATKQGQGSEAEADVTSGPGRFMLTLRRHEAIADQTAAFYFDKPADFTFVPGQSLDLTLLTAGDTDASGNSRTFSIASAPGDAELVVATRLRDSAFKRVLAAMSVDSVLQASGPSGTFTLASDESHPVVFLAGGIGITPFRSMLRDEVASGRTRAVWLFYSNTAPEAAAFLDELQALAVTMPSFQFVPTMTGEVPSVRGWNGLTGMIDAAMLGRHLPLLGPHYYVAGPPAMVVAMQQMLEDAGVSSANVHAEEFAGY